MVKYEGLSTLEVLEGADNYNRWIAERVSPYLSSPVLEIGSGIGTITRLLFSKKKFTATDKDKALVVHLKNEFANEKLTVQLLDIEKKPTSTLHNTYASIVAINVLEHIEDHVKALKHMHLLLKKRGRVVLLVPAKKKAYSRLDKALGHYRRYEKEEIVLLFQENGFKVEHVSFFNIVGLLSWMTRDKIEKNNIHLKPYQIRIFDSIVPILKRIESIILIPVGISIIIVGRKI